MKPNRDSVVNLSDVNLHHEIEEILSLGMNCHTKRKFDQNERKVEIELLYEDIRKKQRSNMITGSEEDSFKCELEPFSTKHIIDHTRDVLNRDQYRKVKVIRNKTQIAIRKSDKRNVSVILNSQYYNDCMED